MRHLKILDAGRVTWGKFYTENFQILGATEGNVAALDLCTPDLRWEENWPIRGFNGNNAYRVLLAKFRHLTQPADVQILNNASCTRTSDVTSWIIICVLPMYAVLYALFPRGFLTRLETRQWMRQPQYYYGMLIAYATGRSKWWRQVTSFGVESGARLWSARTHLHEATAVPWFSTRGVVECGAFWSMDVLLDAPVHNYGVS
jgi:hypothetical protein